MYKKILNELNLEKNKKVLNINLGDEVLKIVSNENFQLKQISESLGGSLKILAANVKNSKFNF